MLLLAWRRLQVQQRRHVSANATRLKTLSPFIVSSFSVPPLTMRPTSTAAAASAMATSSLVLTIVAAVTGYYIGKTSGLRKSEAVSALKETAKSSPATEDEFSATDAEWEDEETDAEGLKETFEGAEGEECKMVLVVRTDLGMTKGKIAAQCGHATLMCYKAALKAAPDLIKRWESRGVAKVAVQVKSEDELLMMQAQAMSLGIVAKIVHDAGRTQIASGSATVLGLGPAPKSVVDQVSGHLKLL